MLPSHVSYIILVNFDFLLFASCLSSFFVDTIKTPDPN